MKDWFVAIIQTLYAASLDAAAWPGALTDLADALGGVDTTLEAHAGPGTIPVFFSCGTRLPDDGVEDYLSYYSKVCLRIPMIDAQTPGSVGVDYDFTSETEMDVTSSTPISSRRTGCATSCRRVSPTGRDRRSASPPCIARHGKGTRPNARRRDWRD